MNSESDATPPKRIGDLLIEAGLIKAEDLPKGLEYSKKTSLPLGRVLIMLRAVTEDDLKYVLHAQSLMKFEGLPASLAVRALSLAKQNSVSLDEALVQVGWRTDKFKDGSEPGELKELREKVAQVEQKVGADHVELAEHLLALGDFYVDNEVFGQAEASYMRAVAILEKNHGSVHLQVGNAIWKLGNLLFLQDRYAEALPYYIRVHEIKESVLGPTHSEVATALHDLAELHDVQNQYAEAERYYMQCIQIREKFVEVDSPQLIDTLKRFCYVAKRVKRVADQINVGELLTQSGLVDQDKLPQGLEFSQKSNVPLGRALISLHHLTEEDLQVVLHAQLLIRGNLLPCSLAIRAVRYASKKRISLEDALQQLGWTGHESGRTYELAELIRTADELVAAEKTMASDDPQLAKLCLKLAELYFGYQKYAEAEMLYKRALGILEKTITGDDSLEIAVLLDRIAEVFLLQEKFGEVESALQRGLQIRETVLGADHLDVSISFEKLGQLYCKKGEHKEAQSWLELALTLKDKFIGSKSLEVAVVVEQMANCFYDTQDYTRAEPLFWRAYEVKKEFVTGSDPQITAMLAKLADLYCKEGKYSMADSVLLMVEDPQKNVFI